MTPEEVGRQVRAVVAAIEPRAAELAEVVTASHLAESAPYTTRTKPDADRIRAAARQCIDLLLLCVAEGRQLTGFEVQAIQAPLTPQDESTFGPHELLRFVRLLTRSLHPHLLQNAQRLSDAPSDAMTLIRELTSSLYALTHQVTASTFEAQLVHRRTVAPLRTEAPDPFGALLSGEGRRPTLEQLRGTRIAVGDVHAVVLIVVGGGTGDGPVSDRLRALMKGAAAALDTGAFRPTSDVRGDLAIILLPFAEGATRGDVADVLVEVLAGAEDASDARPAAGVGRTEAGLGGISRSYRQAVQVVDLQRTHPRLPSVLTYDRAQPYLALTANPEKAMEVYAACVQPLENYDRQQGTALLDTVIAYMEEGGNLQAVSSLLGVHRHTVYSRLERIEEITSRRFADRDDRLLMELGLRARLLLPSPPHAG